METIATLSPRQTFEDNMRPAILLLRVYRLLENDGISSEGETIAALRTLVKASDDEELMLVYNEVFMGLVRERAQVPRSALRRATLCHLLRQAVVASCTALETYLPVLLKARLPIMIRARGRDFVPRGDKTVKAYFKTLTFDLEETLRLLDEENPAEYLANKIVRFVNFKYPSGDRGVHVAGALLGLNEPWQGIASCINRDEDELKRTLNDTFNRRHDIVHRADRARSDPGGDAQEISFAWTQHAVDTVNHICLSLDEMVAARVEEMEALMGERAEVDEQIAQIPE